MNEASKAKGPESEEQELARIADDLEFKRALCRLVLQGDIDARRAQWYYNVLRERGVA